MGPELARRRQGCACRIHENPLNKERPSLRDNAARDLMKGIDYEAWFSRAMWLGILANGLLAVPGICWPNPMLSLLRQTPDLDHPVWPAFASLLLVLLSIFYIPGARQLASIQGHRDPVGAGAPCRRLLLPLAVARPLSAVRVL